MDRLEMEREYDDSSRGRKRDSSLREVKKKSRILVVRGW